MYDSFIDQLSGLDLSGLSIRPAPFNDTDFPCEDAIEQTLGAVWSDLFAMFSDTALEADAEDIAWGMVNLFHRAASRKSAQLDRASDEIRVLLASADGSEVHSSNLEEQVERAQAAEASMLAFEQMREAAAALYRDETGSSWKPVVGRFDELVGMRRDRREREGNYGKTGQLEPGIGAPCRADRETGKAGSGKRSSEGRWE